MQKNKVILENDVTTRRNPNSILLIYHTADKLAQFRLVDENKREEEEAKKETENKTSAKICVFIKRDINIFRNTKNPCITYLCLPPKNPSELSLLNCHRTP